MWNILVVDDEEQILNLVGAFLSRMGYEVTFADGGAKALEILLSGARVDFLVIDIRMPDIDGLAVIRRLWEEGRKVPMVILTGTPDTNGYGQALASMGLSEVHVLHKPVNLFELLAKIEEKLPHKQQPGSMS